MALEVVLSLIGNSAQAVTRAISQAILQHDQVFKSHIILFRASAASLTSADNNTYSIDLSSPWTNQTVTLNTIYKAAPVLLRGALWLDEPKTSFYAYDSGVSFSLGPARAPDPPANELWQFMPSGSSGAWSQVYFDSNSNFTSLVRSYSGIYTSGGGLGFALGGIEDKATGLEAAFNWSPGMIMYNVTSRAWYNVSASGFSYSNTARYGAAHFVPIFGPAGLLFVLGGYVVEALPPFDTVWIFDPVSQQWLSQSTSGTRPFPIFHNCVAGVQGDNDAYEVRILTNMGAL